MRIGVFTPYFYPAPFGGPVRFCYELNSRLSKRGHEIEVFTTNKVGPECSKVKLEEKMDGILVHRFPIFFGVGHYWFTPGLMRKVLSSNFDSVQVHSYRNFQSDIGYLYSIVRGKPLIQFTHGTVHYQLPIDYILKSIHDLVLGRVLITLADRVICTTPNEVHILQRYGVSKEKIEIIPIGINTEFFKPLDGQKFKAKYGIDGKIILYVGRIAKIKSLDLLAYAFKEVSNEVPNAWLVIAGEDHGYKDTLLRILSNLGLLNRTVFTGYLSDEDLLQAYNACDVCILTSKYESYGMALLEAGACSKPVVAPRVGGIPYIVMDGKTGLLAHPGDIRGFADSLIRILNNKNLASEIGMKAREWIVANFSWNVIVPHIEQLQLIRK